MKMKYDLDHYLVQIRRIEEHREKDAEKNIRSIYQHLLRELREFLGTQYARLADQDDRLTYALLQQKGAYARFLEEVEQRINNLTPQAAEEIRKTVEEIYSVAYNGMVNAAKQSDLHEAFEGIEAVTPEVIRQAVENPVSGLTLKDTLERNRRQIVYDIKRNIGVGLMNGDRMSTMARRISTSIDQDYRKAMTIARTETQRAREAGHHDAAARVDRAVQHAGYQMMKTWRTKKDQRVRPNRGIGKKKSRNGANHVRMEGVTIPVDEYFDLGHGVRALAPLQSGDAKNDINCRCRLSYSMVPVENYYNILDEQFGDKNADIQERLEKDVSVLPQSHIQIVERTVKRIIVSENKLSGYSPNTKTLRINKNFNDGHMVHEFGHVLADALHIYENPKFKEILKHHFSFISEGDIMIKTVDDQSIVIVKSKYFVSEYQGRLYGGDDGVSINGFLNTDALQEYFSEGYKSYFMEPEKLRKTDLDLYNFVKEVVESAI